MKNLWTAALGISASLGAIAYYFLRDNHGSKLLHALAGQQWDVALHLARERPGMIPEIHNLPWLIEGIVGTYAPKKVGRRGRKLAKAMAKLERTRREVVSPGGLDAVSWTHENKEKLVWAFDSEGHRAGLFKDSDLVRLLHRACVYETILTVLKAESKDPLVKDLLEVQEVDTCMWEGSAFKVQAQYGLSTYPVTHEGRTYWKVDASRSSWLATRVSEGTQGKAVQLHGWLDQQRWAHPATAIVMAWRHMLLVVNGRTPRVVEDVKRRNQEGSWWHP